MQDTYTSQTEEDILKIQQYIKSQKDAFGLCLKKILTTKHFSKTEVLKIYLSSPSSFFETISSFYNSVIFAIPPLFNQLFDLMLQQKDVFFSKTSNKDGVFKLKSRLETVMSSDEYYIFFANKRSSANLTTSFPERNVFQLYQSVLSISEEMIDIYFKLLDYYYEIFMYLIS